MIGADSFILASGAPAPDSAPVALTLSGLVDDPKTGPFVRVGKRIGLRGVAADIGAGFRWFTLQGGPLGGGPHFCPPATLAGYDLYLEVAIGNDIWKSPAFAVLHAPPRAETHPPPEVFDQSDGVDILPMARFFSGEALVFSSPDPWRLDPVTGVLEIPTDNPVQNGVIRVIASNSGGSATLALPYHVEAGPDHCLWFGDKTLAGHGGCVFPEGATGFGGTGSGGLTLGASGMITAAAQVPRAGPLHFDDGTAWRLQVAAGEYSVASGPEALAALKRAGPGDIVRLRASVRGLVLRLKGLKKPGVTLTGEPGHSVERIEMDRCTGLTLSGLDVRHDNALGPWFKAGDAFYTLVLRNCSSITISDCQFDCDPRQSGGKQDIDSLMRRFGAIRASWSRIEVAGCRFLRARDAIVANDGVAFIHHCSFRQIYEDAITGLHTDWQVDDNQATLFEASYVRDFPGKASGVLRPGDRLRLRDGANALEVVRVRPGMLRARVNNYNLPTAGQQFFAPGGASYSVRGKGEEAPGLNLHGNFFQPILLAGSARDYQVIARRNFVYRSTPYSHSSVAQEPNTEGMRIQRNGGKHYHAPVEITHNVIATGQPAGIHCFFCGDGIVANNSVIWGEMGYRSDIELRNGRNLRVERNAGDDNRGGGVDDQGSHRNTVVAGNLYVSGRTQQQSYNAPYRYPQTPRGLAPRPGSALAQSIAGALRPDGRFRR